MVSRQVSLFSRLGEETNLDSHLLDRNKEVYLFISYDHSIARH